MEGAGAGSSRSSRHGSSRKVSGLLPAALASMNVAPENDDHVGSSGGGVTDSSSSSGGGGDTSSSNGGGNRVAEDPTNTTTAQKAKRPSRVAGTKPALQVDVGGLRAGQQSKSRTGQQEGGEQRVVGTVAEPRVPVEQWTTFNVASWLQRSNLSDAIDPFGTHRIDGIGLRELRILLVGPVTPPPTPQQHGGGRSLVAAA